MVANNTLPLSVFIITLNESDRIARAINSVKTIAQEIIVIDSGSTDNTQEIAKNLGATVVFHAWPGYGLQKRFAEECCSNHWLLNLDADEEVSAELAEEIRGLFVQGEPQVAGFKTTIREIMAVEKDYPRFGYSLSPVRLYNKKYGRYAESTVHDRVVFPPDANIGVLHAPIWHRSTRSLTHAVEKMNRYSTMQSDDLIKRGITFPLTLRLITEVPLAFLKAYFIRGYIRKGMPGFINAMIYAFSRFLRLAKYFENKTKY